jgi:hypothetical protein
MKKTLAIAAALLLATSAFAKPGVSVTVYNQNLALVRDVREMEFSKGAGELLFRDVAGRLINRPCISSRTA